MKKFAVFCVLILLIAAPSVSASNDADSTRSATTLINTMIDWVSSLLNSGELEEGSEKPSENPGAEPEADSDPCGDSTPEPSDSGCTEAFPTVVPGG